MLLQERRIRGLLEEEAMNIRTLLAILGSFCVMFLSGCDRHTAINTEEYVRSKDRFTAGGVVIRLTIYAIPDTGKAKFWKESALVDKRFRSYEITGPHAASVWAEICTREKSTSIDTESRERISYGIVVENTCGGKYFLMLERLHRSKQGKFIGVFGFTDRVWWFEAKDAIWNTSFMMSDKLSKSS